MPNPSTSTPDFTLHYPRKILALGDSFAYGYGDTEGGGWAERLRRHWMQPGQSGDVLYPLGVRGDGILQVEQRWEMEYRCRGELRNRIPDGCILSVGANDSARLGHRKGRNFTALELFEEKLEHLLGGASELGDVWFVGMAPVDEEKMPFAGVLYYSLAEQGRYNDVARRLCHERGIAYLDNFEIWLAKGDRWRLARLTEDGLHPNSLGYQSVFQSLLTDPAFAHLIGGSQSQSSGERELAIA